MNTKSKKIIFILLFLLCFFVLYLSFSFQNEVVYFWDLNTYSFKSESGRVKLFFDLKDKSDFKKESADLNKNGFEEVYILKGGKLTITENSKKVWESPNGWRIDNFVLADVTNDGVTNLSLSLWKSGDFGPSKPFWVEKNDVSIKNHFFVYDFVGGELKQVWGSSNLAMPNCDFKVADVDGDKKNDLIVLEGEYSNENDCVAEYVAVWKWNGWGFSNEWRSEKNIFLGLKIVDGKILTHF